MRAATEYEIASISGELIDVTSPDPEIIHLEDIAGALSNLCRFTGHVKRHYSIAAHSLLVAELARVQGADVELQLVSLMHDAPEYVLNDLTPALKGSIGPTYRELERLWWDAICRRFGLPAGRLAEVKLFDRQALYLERAALLPKGLRYRWKIDQLGIRPPTTPSNPWQLMPAMPQTMCEQFTVHVRCLTDLRRELHEL